MPRLRPTALVKLALVTVALLAAASAAGTAAEPRERHFRFTYGARLKNLPESGRVRVWIPVPQTNEHQTVRASAPETPGKASVSIEPKYGNKILYFEQPAGLSGSLSFKTEYDVQRREVRGFANADRSRTQLDARQRDLFLAPNERVPISGRPIDLLADATLPEMPVQLARTIYERVDEHVRYDKSKPGYGNGDSVWVCDSGFGNCTDFHSLFVSLSRSQGLPARFEIGFAVPPARGEGTIGGYHCWAFFHEGSNGWVPVDISEADKHPEMKDYYFGNLTENRITFTSGRDLTLVPKQDAGPLNFFVYPYVEVDGRPLPASQIDMQFSFADL